MRSHLKKQSRKFSLDPVSHVTVGALLVTALFAACSPETNGRRSAVDAAKLCKDDPDAVFAGSCLQRSASPADPNAARPGETLPEPTPTSTVTAAPSATPTETATVTPVASASPSPTQPPTELPPDKQLPPPAATKNRVLTFKQESFIAVADKTVVMNCHMPAGTKVEFSGEISEVTEFKSLGVSQKIVFKTVSVTYPSGSDQGCSLSGRNFVFLSKHAIEESLP